MVSQPVWEARRSQGNQEPLGAPRLFLAARCGSLKAFVIENHCYHHEAAYQKFRPLGRTAKASKEPNDNLIRPYLAVGRA